MRKLENDPDSSLMNERTQRVTFDAKLVRASPTMAVVEIFLRRDQKAQSREERQLATDKPCRSLQV